MNKDRIIFLVEGSKDSSTLKQLEKLFGENSIELFPSSEIIVYTTCIYHLYNEIMQDRDNIETFRIIKDKDTLGLLANIEREDVSEVFLFFDYDPHASNASNDKLQELLRFFDDESNQGKLYISYPMIEAFRHCYKIIKSGSTIQNLCNTDSVKNLETYKTHVSSTLPDIKHIDCINTIKKLILESLFHAQHLVNTAFEYPTDKKIISQINIFNKQKEKYSDENNYPFYILSSIPLFIFEYHKEEIFKKILICNSKEPT